MTHLVSAFCDGRETNKGLLESLLKIFLQLLWTEVLQEADRKKAEFPCHLKKNTKELKMLESIKALMIKLCLEDSQDLNFPVRVPQHTEDIS